jgi:hypothetical protein
MHVAPHCSVRYREHSDLKEKLCWDSGHYSIAEKENSAQRLATPG